MTFKTSLVNLSPSRASGSAPPAQTVLTFPGTAGSDENRIQPSDLLNRNNTFVGDLVLGGTPYGTPPDSEEVASSVEPTDGRVDRINRATRIPYRPSLIQLDALTLLPGLNVVFGSWGTGKSTLFRAIQASMRNATTTIFTGEPINPVELVEGGAFPQLTSAEDTAGAEDPDVVRRSRHIRMDFVSDEGAADIYEGLRRWNGRTKVLMIDSLRSALYSERAGGLGSSATNAYFHQEVLQMSNVFARSGVTALAVVNPDREDERFVEALRGTIAGSSTQIITMRAATGSSLRMSTSNRINRAEVELELDTSFLNSMADPRTEGIFDAPQPTALPITGRVPSTESNHWMREVQ